MSQFFHTIAVAPQIAMVKASLPAGSHVLSTAFDEKTGEVRVTFSNQFCESGRSAPVAFEPGNIVRDRRPVEPAVEPPRLEDTRAEVIEPVAEPPMAEPLKRETVEPVAEPKPRKKRGAGF